MLETFKPLKMLKLLFFWVKLKRPSVQEPTLNNSKANQQKILKTMIFSNKFMMFSIQLKNQL